MHEAKIILPMYDNDGQPLWLELEAIEADILKAFGGYSRTKQDGCWRDPETGKVYHDEAYAYSIANDWDAKGEALRLLQIASSAAEAMRQECIYVALPKTGVHFVEPVPVWNEAA